MKPLRHEFTNKRVTIMGLGLNGGGLASARFFAQCGAHVTVTDMKTEEILRPSIEALKKFPIRYVLGRHDEDDFRNADLVIKNPAVRPDNPYLALARRVETDLSIFLSILPCPLIAVTGSKGKSTTASAIYHILKTAGKKAFLGGNITISPLDFIDEIDSESIVVLEMSSWQLGDLRGKSSLHPLIAVITHIVPDHLDRYGNMEAYIADKRVIYANQDSSDYTICEHDEWGLSFAQETRAQCILYGHSKHDKLPYAVLNEKQQGILYYKNKEYILVPENLSLPGLHNRLNLLAASTAAMLMGIPDEIIRDAVQSFTGVEHRMERFAVAHGIEWYNDSAATVPQAVAAAINALSDKPLILITGGTDKALDFEPVADEYAKPKALILLAGTGSDKLITSLSKRGIPYYGPYPNLKEAVQKAYELAGTSSRVILSPGCTSFGMFKNEFDRGLQYKLIVKELLGVS